MRKQGFATFAGNGFELDLYHARRRADVARAVALEWGDEATSIRIERVPAHTIYGDEPRYVDLTTNSGWNNLNAGECE